MTPEDDANVRAAIGGLDQGDGKYPCPRCKIRFKSPVEVRHHRCTGVPLRRPFKTKQVEQQLRDPDKPWYI